MFEFARVRDLRRSLASGAPCVDLSVYLGSGINDRIEPMPMFERRKPNAHSTIVKVVTGCALVPNSRYHLVASIAVRFMVGDEYR